jgi:hypothetical protein
MSGRLVLIGSLTLTSVVLAGSTQECRPNRACPLRLWRALTRVGGRSPSR